VTTLTWCGDLGGFQNPKVAPGRYCGPHYPLLAEIGMLLTDKTTLSMPVEDEQKSAEVNPSSTALQFVRSRAPSLHAGPYLLRLGLRWEVDVLTLTYLPRDATRPAHSR
jgi:hypothetical protein